MVSILIFNSWNANKDRNRIYETKFIIFIFKIYINFRCGFILFNLLVYLNDFYFQCSKYFNQTFIFQKHKSLLKIR